MANGHGMRWGNHLGIPKHLISVNGETLIERIVRQVRKLEPGADIVISSSNEQLETPGARRHNPLINEIELDRFPPELVSDSVTFLYGDTFYTQRAIETIIDETQDHQPMRFFGDSRSIVAVEANDGLTMLSHLHNVRSLFLNGEIDSCVGWQVYQSYYGLPFGAPLVHSELHSLAGLTAGFNTPEDLTRFHKWYVEHKATNTDTSLSLTA